MSEALKRLLAAKAKREAEQVAQSAPVSAPTQASIEEKKDEPQTARTEVAAANELGVGSDNSGTEVTETARPEPEQETEVHEPAQESGPVPVTSKSTHPILMEMAALEEALNKNVPDFANKLREIHIKLKQDPHIVTLLSDEEIGIIVAGMEKHTNVQIVAPATRKASTKKALANVSASDL